MLKPHETFTNETDKLIADMLPGISSQTRGNLLHNIVQLSRMGLTPEVVSIGKERVLNTVLSMPDNLFRDDVGPAPIAPPPAPIVLIPPKSAAPSTIDINNYKFGAESMRQLEPVITPLRQCALLAIGYSLVDFRVRGLRTIAMQAEYVRKGTSTTMASKHLPTPEGIVRAIDCEAVVNGSVSWDFDYYFYIARAMDRAATELNIADKIRWGAAWDRVLGDIGYGLYGSDEQETKAKVRVAYMQVIEAYKKRHAGKDFIDGPHFEWIG